MTSYAPQRLRDENSDMRVGSHTSYEPLSPQESIRNFLRNKLTLKQEPHSPKGMVSTILTMPKDHWGRSQQSLYDSGMSLDSPVDLPQDGFQTLHFSNEPEEVLENDFYFNNGAISSRKTVSLELLDSNLPLESSSGMKVARKKISSVGSYHKDGYRLNLTLGLCPLSPVPRIPLPSPNIELTNHSPASYTPPLGNSWGLQSPLASTKFGSSPNLGVPKRRASQSPERLLKSLSPSKRTFTNVENIFISTTSLGLLQPSSFENLAKSQEDPNDQIPYDSDAHIPIPPALFYACEGDRKVNANAPTPSRLLPRSKGKANSLNKTDFRDPLTGMYLSKPQSFISRVHDDPKLPFLLHTVQDAPMDDDEIIWYDVGYVTLPRQI